MYIDPLERALAYLATYAEEHAWPPIDQITTGHLEEYIVYFRARPLWFGDRAKGQGRTPSSSYVDSQRRRLLRFFGWLKTRGHIPANPMDLVGRPRVEKKVVPTVPESSVEDLLRLTDPSLARTPGARFRAYRDRALIYLLWDTPSRRAEIMGLQVDDVDLDGAVVVVRGKGRKERPMPLGSAACKVLREYLRERDKVAPDGRKEFWVDQSGHGLSRPAWLYQHIKRLGLAAGIPNLHTHRFRHSYAMNALRGGMPMPVLEWTGGWSRIPETYIRTLGMEDARRFHQQVSPGDRLGHQRQRVSGHGDTRPRGRL